MAWPGMEWKAKPGAKSPLYTEMKAEAENGDGLIDIWEE